MLRIALDTDSTDNQDPETSLPDGLAKERSEKLFSDGMYCFLHNDYRQAIQHFTAAIKIDDANARFYARRGEAFRLVCDYRSAIADFDVALRLNPEAPILVSRASAYLQEGDSQRAIEDCTAALKLNGADPEAYRVRAAAYADLQGIELALADWDQLLTLNPDDPEARYRRAVLRSKQSDFVGAVSDLDRAVGLNPYHIQAYVQRGHAHRCLGNHAQAVCDYNEVLRHHPTNLLALAGRGIAYKLRGDGDRAIADFDRVLRHDPDNGQAYYHRGVIYRARGDIARARTDLDEALRCQPDHWAALYFRGKIFLAEGQFALAILDLTEVLRLNRTAVVAHLSRALAHDRLGQFQEGISDGTAAIKLDANSPAAYLVRGVIYAHKGEYADAVADLSQAIRLNDRFALAYQERSMAYMLQREYDRAQDDCNRLIALEPANAQAYASRSIIHHFKGQVQQALTDYTRALQIDPASIMIGWNQSLAENARSRTAQRLADYVDGLRTETPVVEAPPPAEFEIVVKPASVKETDTHLPVLKDTGVMIVAPETEAPPASEEIAPRHPPKPAPAAEKSSPPAKPQRKPKKPTEIAAVFSPVSVCPPSTKVDPIPKEDYVKPSIDDVADDRRFPLSATVAAEATVDAAIDELLADSPEAPEVPDSLQPRAAVRSTPAHDDKISAHLSGLTVTCPNCKNQTKSPEEVDGRLRCRHCQSLFTPWSGVKKPVKRKVESTSFLEKWKKPVPMASTIAAGLLLIYFCFPVSLFGKSDRVRVYEAQGKIEFQGKPITNAAIFLHPVGVNDVSFPRPRATVKADGTFVVGTYTKDDGAPVGEYKLTVAWFDMESGHMPRNLLPPKYSKPESSTVTVRIQDGKNQFSPIKLSF
jgi:tetratricopeptide (TPR) repeat protein